jgi:FtsH-binding integral membrane protein
MPEDLFMARLFWIVGGVLALLGAVLWFTVPIRPMFPPYVVTALAALGYSFWCRRRASRHVRSSKS